MIGEVKGVLTIAMGRGTLGMVPSKGFKDLSIIIRSLRLCILFLSAVRIERD